MHMNVCTYWLGKWIKDLNVNILKLSFTLINSKYEHTYFYGILCLRKWWNNTKMNSPGCKLGWSMWKPWDSQLTESTTSPTYFIQSKVKWYIWQKELERSQNWHPTALRRLYFLIWNQSYLYSRLFTNQDWKSVCSTISIDMWTQFTDSILCTANIPNTHTYI